MPQSTRIIPATQKSAATNDRNFRSFLLMQQFAAQEIGARIRQARKERGLSQQQLAEMAPFSIRSLQYYEAGDTIPYKHLRDIARLLNRPEEWFLYGEKALAEDDPSVMSALSRIEQVLEELVARSDPDEQAEDQPA